MWRRSRGDAESSVAQLAKWGVEACCWRFRAREALFVRYEGDYSSTFKSRNIVRGRTTRIPDLSRIAKRYARRRLASPRIVAFLFSLRGCPVTSASQQYLRYAPKGCAQTHTYIYRHTHTHILGAYIPGERSGEKPPILPICSQHLAASSADE